MISSLLGFCLIFQFLSLNGVVHGKQQHGLICVDSLKDLHSFVPAIYMKSAQFLYSFDESNSADDVQRFGLQKVTENLYFITSSNADFYVPER
jgi:hypothetical protein